MPKALQAAKIKDQPQRVEVHIGEQIRELRKIKGVTLQEMADRVGISVGYLSQIERNRSKLPIGVLKSIADVLEVNMNWFFQNEAVSVPEDERDIIVREGNRREMVFTGIGISEELLSPNLSGPLELLLSTIEAKADSGEYSHNGAEAGLVVAGRLELWIGGRYFLLNSGDSFSFRSTETHRIRNPDDAPAKVVWVITPPHY